MIFYMNATRVRFHLETPRLKRYLPEFESQSSCANMCVCLFGLFYVFCTYAFPGCVCVFMCACVFVCVHMHMDVYRMSDILHMCRLKSVHTYS